MDRVWLHEMTWPEVEQVRKRTATILLPTGATEQHGPHLPLGTDTLIPIYVAQEVAKRTGIPIAPPIWFSTSEMHMGFCGTVSLRPSTLMMVLRDITESLARHGFRHFVLLNGHQEGANPSLLAAADEIQITNPALKLWVIDLMLTARKAVLDACESNLLIHAEEIEVSNMLVIAKDLVNLAAATNVEPAGLSEFIVLNARSSADRVLSRFTAGEWRSISENQGQIGDPTLGTEAKGHLILNSLTENVVRFVGQLK
jgi:creatinine amidohydrolase